MNRDLVSSTPPQRFPRILQRFLRIRTGFLCLMLTLVLTPLMTSHQAAAQQKDEKETPPDPFVVQSIERRARGEWDLLIQECDQVLQAEPTKGAAFVFKGIALNGKGDHDGAIAQFAKVFEQTGRDPITIQNRADAYTNRSTSYYKKGEYLKAIDSAYFALLEKGNHAEAHNNRGVAYLARRQFDKAITSFDRAIGANPKYAAAYSNRGFAYGAKGNFDQVIADQNKALELDPNLAVAYQRRAAAIIAKADTKSDPQKDLDQALTLDPNFTEALCDRALLYSMKGELPRAKADLDLALKIDPHCAKAHLQRGRAYLSQKNYYN